MNDIPKFDEARAKDLENLIILMAEIRCLNYGSDFLGKVKNCIDRANKLSVGKDNFVAWLTEKNFAERLEAKETSKADKDGFYVSSAAETDNGVS